MELVRREDGVVLYVVEFEEEGSELASWAFTDEMQAERQAEIARAAIPVGAHQDMDVSVYRLEAVEEVSAVVRVFSAMIHDVAFVRKVLSLAERSGNAVKPGRGLLMEKFVFGEEADEAIAQGDEPWIREDEAGRWVWGLSRGRVMELADKLGEEVLAKAVLDVITGTVGE
jgi:hypothetical protein